LSVNYLIRALGIGTLGCKPLTALFATVIGWRNAGRHSFYSGIVLRFFILLRLVACVVYVMRYGRAKIKSIRIIRIVG